MEKIKIQTAQNITIEHDIASVGDRIAANIVDSLIFTAYYVVIFVFLGFGSGFGNMSDLIWIVVIASIPAFFYHLICEVLMEGQTFGMKAVRTKVIRVDGNQPTFGNYLIRWFLRLVDVTLSYGGVALITIIINGKGQRLGDIAAGTTVMKMKKPVNLSDTILTQTKENYVPVFTQVEKLTDREIGIVVETLSVYRYQGKMMPVQVVAKKIKEVLHIETNMKALEFLKTIVKDYNHITGKVNEL
ncbi:MAG: RDD family protein, partial [Cytophagaceae bacterium]